jgi:hypothetical protein
MDELTVEAVARYAGGELTKDQALARLRMLGHEPPAVREVEGADELPPRTMLSRNPLRNLRRLKHFGKLRQRRISGRQHERAEAHSAQPWPGGDQKGC